MKITSWKTVFAVLVTAVLSAIGIKSAPAEAALQVQREGFAASSLSDPQLAQTCPYGDKPQPYARVVTQRDPLVVRSSPNGRIIGSIPKGWAVVTVRKDSTGRWVRVTSHYGDIQGLAFGSAPDFASGWVSAKFLKNIGTHCEKPMATSSLLQPELFGQRETVVQADWVELGDRIASMIGNP